VAVLGVSSLASPGSPSSAAAPSCSPRRSARPARRPDLTRDQLPPPTSAKSPQEATTPHQKPQTATTQDQELPLTAAEGPRRAAGAVTPGPATATPSAASASAWRSDTWPGCASVPARQIPWIAGLASRATGSSWCGVEQSVAAAECRSASRRRLQQERVPSPAITEAGWTFLDHCLSLTCWRASRQLNQQMVQHPGLIQQRRPS